jgi:outer membrane protein assembly factor BamB
MSRVVVTNRVLYVTFDRVQGRLAAFDATTGQELWTYFYEHAVRYEFNDPILHDGLILTGTECQGMFAIDATTGTLAWHVLGS